MTPERRSEIAGKGGKAAHVLGRAHTFTSAQAKDAGAKGGAIVSKDRRHMARIGRKGGVIVSRDPAHMKAIGKLGGANHRKAREV